MKLWLIRHAKSDWNEPGLADFDRPLNARGERDGPAMADWLAAQSDPASWVWTSTARRARTTAGFVQLGFSLSDNAVIGVDDLYHATPEQILDVVRQTPSEVQSVAVVAHNPGMTWLVNGMGQDAITENLPTFGIARFDCAGDWASLRAGSARLDFLVSPKTLPDPSESGQ